MSDDNKRKPLPTTEADCPTRRDALARIGSWLVFAGTASACGGGGLGGSEFHRSGTTVSATCDCGAATGTATGLHTTDIPVNGIAYNATDSIFICHDAAGFYAVDSLCTHAGCDMGAQGGFSSTNLAAGFGCGCHGSNFNADGHATSGPASGTLYRFHLGIDAGGAIFIDATTRLSDSSCRCT